MKLLTVFVLVANCCTLAVCQSESESEPKDRYLSLPKLDKCNNRFKEAQYKNRNFFFSGHNPELKDKRLDWLDSRNTCREYCMETVSFETQEKFDFYKTYIEKHNISFIWTSGRLCDFDGCHGRWDLLPKRIKGWLWSANQMQLADTNKTPPDWKYQPWSFTGVRKKPQPDNAEFYLSQTGESCIGILNNMYNDSITFHDIACYHKTRFICEDSELLLQEVLEKKDEMISDETEIVESTTTRRRVAEVETTTTRRRVAEVETSTKKVDDPETTLKSRTADTETASKNIDEVETSTKRDVETTLKSRTANVDFKPRSRVTEATTESTVTATETERPTRRRRTRVQSTTKEIEVESTTNKIEVESSTRNIEAETTTRNIEAEDTSPKIVENTSKTTKTVETTESKVLNAKKENQFVEKDPSKPPRRRKLVRKKVQTESSEEKIVNKQPEIIVEPESTTENANSTLTVETENVDLKKTLDSTDDAKGEEKVVEQVETTTVAEAKSTTKSPFRNRNRGQLGRSRF